MDEKEKYQLLKDAEEISKKNMSYTPPKKKKTFGLMVVVILYLIAAAVSLFFAAYLRKFLM